MWLFALGCAEPAPSGSSPEPPPPTSASPTPTPPPPAGTNGPGWWAEVGPEGVDAAPLLADGCLGDVVRIGPGTLAVAAADAAWVWTEVGVVRAEDVTLDGGPEALPEVPAATVRTAAGRYHLGPDGCAVLDGTWVDEAPVLAIDRVVGENYRGLALVSRDLALVGVRYVDAPGWEGPWLASVQLLLGVSGGYVIGGGVVVGEHTILTAAHLGAGPGWCWSPDPNTGRAAAEGTLVCDAIAEPAEPRPDGVDAALVHTTVPIGLPAATLGDPVASGDAFFSSAWSLLVRNAFVDGVVDRVGNDNAFCEAWPADTSFVATEPIVGPGDSGGPAWVDDGLVGLVHGERCRNVLQPVEQVFVHVPPLRAWIEAGTW